MYNMMCNEIQNHRLTPSNLLVTQNNGYYRINRLDLNCQQLDTKFCSDNVTVINVYD